MRGAVLFAVTVVAVAGVLVAHIVPPNTLSSGKGEAAVYALDQPRIAVVRRVLSGADIAFHIVAE